MSYAPAASATFLAGLTRVTGFSIFTRLNEMAELRRQRRALAELDAYALADIGVTADEAETESARPVWDAPVHWHK
ncbi:MAG: DUF1127 domain-containing protein [Paracoccaceae bacterium]|nr:DUF1127 domain-containing protein [Paracoccaceae bacterium]MDP7185250.1 DUF1127 domain-containing protein [Paracoccaceae bacterium]